MLSLRLQREEIHDSWLYSYKEKSFKVVHMVQPVGTGE